MNLYLQGAGQRGTTVSKNDLTVIIIMLLAAMFCFVLFSRLALYCSNDGYTSSINEDVFRHERGIYA